MDDQLISEEILRRSQTDEWYQQCRQEVEKYEPAYEAIRTQLPGEQREQLELYIAGCENLEYALSFIAYRLGQEHGLVVNG